MNSMFELIIKRPDGSVYWIEYFNGLEEANTWIAEEKTRPYWNTSYTYEIVDHAPPPLTQAEKDKLEKVKLESLKAKQDLNNKTKTDSERIDAIIKLLNLG